MKSVLFLLLGASVALNIYLVNVEVVVKDDLDLVEPESYEKAADTISIAQAAPRKHECEPRVIKKVVEKIVYKEPAGDRDDLELSEKVDQLGKEETERLASKYRREWREKSQDFFDYRLGLTPSQQDEYHSLKALMEEEISKLLTSKTGAKEGEARMLSSQEMVKMGDIHKKYETKLKSTFGDQAYNEYVRFKNHYNKTLTQKGHGFLGVGF